MAGDSRDPADAPARVELGAAPPFASWRAVYAIVLGALLVEIALAAALTAWFS